MLAGGEIDPAGFDRTLGAVRAWGDRPDAAIWFARCWAEGVRES
jgi:hypothetical protein